MICGSFYVRNCQVRLCRTAVPGSDGRGGGCWRQGRQQRLLQPRDDVPGATAYSSEGRCRVGGDASRTTLLCCRSWGLDFRRATRRRFELSRGTVLHGLPEHAPVPDAEQRGPVPRSGHVLVSISIHLFSIIFAVSWHVSDTACSIARSAVVRDLRYHGGSCPVLNTDAAQIPAGQPGSERGRDDWADRRGQGWGGGCGCSVSRGAMIDDVAAFPNAKVAVICTGQVASGDIAAQQGGPNRKETCFERAAISQSGVCERTWSSLGCRSERFDRI